MRKIWFLAVIVFTFSANAEESAQGNALTIYSKAAPGSIDPNIYRPVAGGQNYGNYSVPGYAVVRHVREVNLGGKHTVLKFQDVAAKLDPTTVQFKSLTDEKGTKVTEQNYQFDLVSQQKLLQKYIDKEITVERNVGDNIETISGTLMSTDGGLTLKNPAGKIMIINDYSSIQFPELPGGLITKPTLVWDIYTAKTGKHQAEVAYQTEGITWWADYNLTYREGKNANSGLVDFGSWVSIINQSGASYNNAKLKLMAGDVQRAAPPQNVYRKEMRMLAMEADSAAPSFEEKAFFEYHLYTLNRPADLPDNSTKQLELIPQAQNVPVEKIYLYNGNSQAHYGGVNTNRDIGTQSNKKVDIYLKLKNDEKSGLGVPLPSGRLRVNQRDDDGSLEFIGEDIIDHTARNEDVLVRLGSAFDVVGERKQIDFSYDSNRKIIEEEFEIKLRNQKKKGDVKVIVKENLYRAANWKIISSSDKYDKENSNTIHFPIEIDAGEEKTIRYRVRYSW
ncbi:MAG: DUF4139 domain-containing protein [Alphaproteobacteria bacterium CG11_big_fil_rev_8_21_14_0_20_44_7]|nr:MAG: DUF4139 domain-containing protein [Alphaproteobacteria bacterium CG11_big_fil_rev_8_21_14_0_20_44_7]